MRYASFICCKEASDMTKLIDLTAEMYDGAPTMPMDPKLSISWHCNLDTLGSVSYTHLQVIGDLPDMDIHLKIRLHDNRAVKITVKLSENAFVIEFKLDTGLVEDRLHLANPFPVVIVGRF